FRGSPNGLIRSACPQTGSTVHNLGGTSPGRAARLCHVVWTWADRGNDALPCSITRRMSAIARSLMNSWTLHAAATSCAHVFVTLLGQTVGPWPIGLRCIGLILSRMNYRRQRIRSSYSMLPAAMETGCVGLS